MLGIRFSCSYPVVKDLLSSRRSDQAPMVNWGRLLRYISGSLDWTSQKLIQLPGEIVLQSEFTSSLEVLLAECLLPVWVLVLTGGKNSSLSGSHFASLCCLIPNGIRLHSGRGSVKASLRWSMPKQPGQWMCASMRSIGPEHVAQEAAIVPMPLEK